MSNEIGNIGNLSETITVPSSQHGMLSTGLTDNTADYVWFDCEAEF